MTLWVRWCELGPGPGMGGWVGEEEGECGTCCQVVICMSIL